jgi:LysR family glycine cleavage system transcriptional activator
MSHALPPLKWLVTFRSVMETGSFARAAAALNLTPSAVSHQMRSLEQMLGRALFVRANRSVRPTEEAISYTAAILDSFDRLALATRRVQAGSRSSRLAIHSSPSFAAMWLMPRLGSFIRAFPEMDVTLASSNEPVRLGDEGFALGIQHARPVPEDCEGIVLAEESIVPLASPAFVAAHGLERIADIAHVPLIYSVRSLAQWDQWALRYAPDTVVNPRGMQFDRSYLSLAAAVDGLGLALESTLLASEYLRTGRLIMPFGPLGIDVIAHRVLYRHDDRDDPKIRLFIDWMMEALAADRRVKPRAATAKI